MNRHIASIAAGITLIGLTLLTWHLADGGASAWVLAALALAKITVVAVVFLELMRSWPVWWLASATMVLAVLGGSAWLITG